MKHIIFATALLFSGLAAAREFQGTMVLKGSLKTKLMVNSVDTTCRVELDRIKNILDEDSYGNPGYTARVSVKLDGRDLKRKLEVKFDQRATLSNFFKVGEKVEARDFQYADHATNTGMTMEINEEGRVENVKFLYQGRPITCLF